jgi:hypothetical protein
LKKIINLLDFQISWVEKQLLVEQSVSACPLKTQTTPKTSLKWTGSIVEWVELIYALHFVRRINNGNISLKELFREMGIIFDFKVKEFANYFMNIKNRSDEKRTKYIDLMKEVLLKRITDADHKPSRK